MLHFYLQILNIVWQNKIKTLIDKSRKKSNYDILRPVLRLALEQLDLIMKVYTDEIECCNKYLNEEFKYNEQEQKEEYEKDLQAYNERIEKYTNEDKSEAYKRFLSQIEQIYQRIGE